MTNLRQAVASSEIDLVWHRDASGISNERMIDVVVACGHDLVDMTALVRRVTASPLLVLGGDEIQAVTCLNLGADVWLPVATSTSVIAAQLSRLMLARRDRPASTALIAAGNVVIDMAERRVTLHGRELDLAPREYELLRVMAENAGKALSRDRILAAAWGPRFVGEPKTVDVHVAWLRQKLEGSGLRVTTLRGLGYRLDVIPGPVNERAVAHLSVTGRSTSTGPQHAG
ncbi:MAG: winged helix-turn-helix domain-containing protein [Candidatus Dormibacter sp.]